MIGWLHTQLQTLHRLVLSEQTRFRCSGSEELMGHTASADWIAVRDEWVNRRLAGELLSLKDLASQKDLNYDTLRKRAAADGWQESLGQRQARISARVAEQTETDHVKVRLRLLTLGSKLQQLADDMVGLYAERVAHEAAKPVVERLWHPTASDVARIAATSVKLAEAGGAIPREDQLPVEPVHPEVAANRAQMKEIEAAVMGMCEWQRQKRAAQKADETPVH